ncbi:MAG: hypothetical protein BWZ02_02584 [Lentisphaerae bacterium ADurb.BinA184]|nr:MAG: hypothetical protein BWZ02_02584 [Lentisphaerae bacterium ADurb.BinA184]
MPCGNRSGAQRSGVGDRTGGHRGDQGPGAADGLPARRMGRVGQGPSRTSACGRLRAVHSNPLCRLRRNLPDVVPSPGAGHSGAWRHDGFPGLAGFVWPGHGRPAAAPERHTDFTGSACRLVCHQGDRVRPSPSAHSARRSLRHLSPRGHGVGARCHPSSASRTGRVASRGGSSLAVGRCRPRWEDGQGVPPSSEARGSPGRALRHYPPDGGAPQLRSGCARMGVPRPHIPW